ncbi:hypothetical protein [Actinomadura napierensis]|uniref:SDR family NAD(P)-dependent oxidoreductase n=1 Tax=Actinomadura napierensis TaxID=267854 RepID=A0ABP5M051_9ACTN
MAATRQVIVVTGASSGFGRLTAVALTRAGHAVAAGMRRLADLAVGAVLDRYGRLDAAEDLLSSTASL